MGTEILIAVITSGTISTVITKILEAVSSRKGEKYAMRLLLKTKVRELCLFYLGQGWIYADELDDLVEMHTCYHNTLHGNGYLDKLMGEVMKLQVKGLPREQAK